MSLIIMNSMKKNHVLWLNKYLYHDVYIDGLAQDCSNSIANALELLQSCTKLSIYETIRLGWVKATSFLSKAYHMFLLVYSSMSESSSSRGPRPPPKPKGILGTGEYVVPKFDFDKPEEVEKMVDIDEVRWFELWWYNQCLLTMIP